MSLYATHWTLAFVPPGLISSVLVALGKSSGNPSMPHAVYGKAWPSKAFPHLGTGCHGLTLFFSQNAVPGTIGSCVLLSHQTQLLTCIALLAMVLSQNELAPCPEMLLNPYLAPTAPSRKRLPFFLPIYFNEQMNICVFTGHLLCALTVFGVSFAQLPGCPLKTRVLVHKMQNQKEAQLSRLLGEKSAVKPKPSDSKSRVLLCFRSLKVSIIPSGRLLLQKERSLQWHSSAGAGSQDEKVPFLSVLSLCD